MEENANRSFDAHRDWQTHQFSDATETRQTAIRVPGEKALLVVGSTFFGRFALPRAGRLVIGRSPECGIVLDEGSVSRQHAALTLGPVDEIEDLHSANGTRIGDDVVPGGQRMPVNTGQPFSLGGVTLIIQPTAGDDRQPGFLPLATFMNHVDDSLRILRPDDPPAAIVRFRASEGIAEGALQRAVARELNRTDLLGCVRPWDYVAMIRCLGDWRARVSRIRDRLATKRIKCEAGIAVYPEDGQDAAALLEASSRQLTVGSTSATGNSAEDGDGTGSWVEGVKMRALRYVVERISAGNLSILVCGETGVGKELMSQRVHAMSPRREQKLVSFNCGALSESLLESELFGHERGAFTGAEQRSVGLLESANGGSVFLDEIGELPMSMQVKLLRVLEERKVRRVGGVEGIDLDVRFIAATNRDLSAEVQAGRFRQDLYYRLAGAVIYIPPLRERKDEIRRLAELFIELACKDLGRAVRPSLSFAAATMLLDYDWPGNVRELRNVVERAVLLCSSGELLPEHLVLYQTLPQPFMAGMASSDQPLRQLSTAVDDLPVEPGMSAAGDPDHPSMHELIKREVAELEKEHILGALAQCKGNQTQAAKLLGISRRTLINRLDAYKVPRPRKR